MVIYEPPPKKAKSKSEHCEKHLNLPLPGTTEALAPVTKSENLILLEDELFSTPWTPPPNLMEPNGPISERVLVQDPPPPLHRIKKQPVPAATPPVSQGSSSWF